MNSGKLSLSRWGLILVVCLFVGITFAVQGYIYANQKGYPLSLYDSFLEQLPFWMIWGFFAPLIFRFIQRVPLDRGRWIQGVLLHIPGCNCVFDSASHNLPHRACTLQRTRTNGKFKFAE